MGKESLAKKAVRAPRNVGEAIENNARIAHYLHMARKGMSPEEATKSVNKFLFDYADLTSFETNWMKRFFPFYVWCVPTDHEILTQEGWKEYDQLTIGENVMVLDPKTHEQRWEPLEDIATFDYDYDLLEYNVGNATFRFTFDHRWPVQSQIGKRSIKRTYEMHKTDYVPWIGSGVFTQESILPEREAAILGWLVTDGYHRWRGNHLEALVYQSPKKHLDEVVSLLGTEPRDPHPDTGVVAVPVSLEDTNTLRKAGFSGKEDLLDIVGKLSREAAEAMWQAMMDAEGCVAINHEQFVQTAGPVMDAFQMLCYMTGRGFHISDARGEVQSGYIRRSKGTKLMMNATQVPYSGKVWCPVTKTGTWFMRHDGAVIATGNSRNNIPLQVEQVLKQPAKYKTVLRALEEMGTGELTAEEKQFMPDYIREGFGINVGRGPTGELQMLSGLGLPLEDLGRAGKPLQLAGNMLSPFAKVPFEALTGQSIFYGEPIDETGDYTATTKAIGQIPGLKQFLKARPKERADGGTYYEVDPQRMYALKTIAGRFIGTAEKFTDERKDLTPRLANILTGLKIYTPDIEREKEEVIMEMLKELGLARTFSKDYVPSETREELGV